VVGSTVTRDVATTTCGVTPKRVKIGTYRDPPPPPRVVTSSPITNPNKGSKTD